MSAISQIIPANLEHLASTCPSIFQTERHPSRSDKYTFISTLDQIKALMAEGFQVASAKQSKCRNPDNTAFTKHMVRLRTLGIGNAEIAPEVLLINSHNGGGASKCLGGALRFFCFNGLVVSEGSIEAVHIQHRGDVMADVIEGVMTVMSHARNIVRVVDDWSKIDMNAGKQVELAQRALDLRWPRVEGKPVNNIVPKQLLECRRNEDLGDDLWHVFNRIQESVIQGGVSYVSNGRDNSGRTQIRNIKSRPVRGIDQDVGLNQKLWALAEEYAQAA